MQVVINNCFGGFGLSLKAQKRYAELKGFALFFYKQTRYPWDGDKEEFTKITDIDKNCFGSLSITKDLGNVTDSLPDGSYFFSHNIERTDPVLLQVIQELGDAANGECSSLKIVDIPDGVDWQIDEYDGNEWVAEKHQTWS